MNYRLRSCTEHDLPALIQLCAHHAAYEQCAYDPSGKLPLLREALFGDRPSLFCFVAEVDDVLVGYTSYTIDYSTWQAVPFIYMDCLYLESAFRGHGIGEALINLIKQKAIDCNIAHIQWQTPSFNEGAIRFYKRIGATSMDKVRFTLSV